LELAWIPPGSFLMGSPREEKGRPHEEKQHRVTLTRGFWLGVFPITQAQWTAVMVTNPSGFSSKGARADSILNLKRTTVESFPVECVSWTMAREFCAALTERLGRPVTLPTEAQWEYACRAGTTTPFHFGSVLDGTQTSCDGLNPYGTDR